MTRIYKTTLLLFIFIICTTLQPAFGQLSELKEEIKNIVADKHLQLGFAMRNLASGEEFFIHGNHRFPMQSVYKFPIAVAAMQAVDHGKLSLTDTLFLSANNLYADTWSPLRERYPQGVALPLSDVITYMVAHSDNCATDLVFQLLDGPAFVQKSVKKWGGKGIHIRNTEKEMQSNWNIQFANFTTPRRMLRYLELFANNDMLSQESNHFLWQVMCSTSTGSFTHHIPENVVVARKTGTSGKSKLGIIAAQNDVGIMEFENGQRIAYAIFITNSAEGYDTNADIIAKIGKAIYTYYGK